MNRPLHYNLFLVTSTCHTCGEEYLTQDIHLAREIPKGVAYSPPKPNEKMFDVPVHKKTVQRDIPWCSMCVDRVERVVYVDLDNRKVLNKLNDKEKPEIELDLEALGLI